MSNTIKVPVTTGRTKSEEIFEHFLAINRIAFERIPEDYTSRPDYLVRIGQAQLIFEVKELAEDEHFGVIADPQHPELRSHSRTLGDHVRARIKGSRKQIQHGANQGLPAILLIYNNLDYVFQDFGTSGLDFTTAMYGELTILVDKRSRAASELFNGRNQSLQETKNTSFSAVGRLCDRRGKTTITLFENVFAKVRVPYELLPPCFDAKQVEVSREPLRFRSESTA